MYKKHIPKRQKMAKITKFASFDDIFLFLASLTSLLLLLLLLLSVLLLMVVVVMMIMIVVVVVVL